MRAPFDAVVCARDRRVRSLALVLIAFALRAAAREIKAAGPPVHAA
jgi:hypothetical protein